MMVATSLSDSLKRERVLSLCDASDVLRDAFFQTEDCLNHQYEVFISLGFLILICMSRNFFFSPEIGVLTSKT